MVPQEFANFFTTSAGASAALIGLLFVAVSKTEPYSVFGSEARADRHAAATGAFAALANASVISLGALIPGANPGGVVLVVGGCCAAEHARVRPGTVAQAARGAVRWAWGVAGARRPRPLRDRDLVRVDTPTRFGGRGGRLLYRPGVLLLGVYVVGLGRAWELLGAPQKGILAWLFSPASETTHGRRVRMSRDPSEKPAVADSSAPGRPSSDF